jgi:hypothetical protein
VKALALSDRPLLKGNVIKISKVDDYTELLVIENDPTSTLNVGHIRIDNSDATALPYINIFLDGKVYLKDFPMLASPIVIDFGRHVVLNRTKKPIVIQMKKTAAGAGVLTATAFVDGVEVRQ